ncbi:DUF2283 domain-containing protein [Microbacterium oxydans]|nr:DUF2283 domain-containing protein [Microbacterium oxydans]
MDAAYLTVGHEVQAGEICCTSTGDSKPSRSGEIILDFDADGHLLGVEILQASKLLRSDDLDRAERISSEPS